MGSDDTQASAQLTARISAHLQQEELQEAKDLTATLVLCPEALRQSLPDLERKFRKSGQLELLVEVLWANRDSALNDMFALGHFMRFCSKLDLYHRFGPLLRSWIAADSTPDFTFSEYAHFRHFRKLTDEQEQDFVDAKYRRWKDFMSQDFFRAVDQFSEFARVSSPITQFLFERRDDKSVPFSRWMADFRSSETLKHILADTRTIIRLGGRRRARKPGQSLYPNIADYSSLFDLDHAKSLFAQLDLSKGLLLSTMHDAHLLVAKRCVVLCMPGRHALGLEPGQNRIGVKGTSAAAAAFHAVKVLQSKKVLLMVPDARHEAKQTSEAMVLEIEIAFADGAPTIAFESGCATAWFTMVREADRFVPAFEWGPSRETGESFKNFKNRWWAFYAASVAKRFTGDPRNITLWHFWTRLIYSAGVAAMPTGHACPIDQAGI